MNRIEEKSIGLRCNGRFSFGCDSAANPARRQRKRSRWLQQLPAITMTRTLSSVMSLVDRTAALVKHVNVSPVLRRTDSVRT